MSRGRPDGGYLGAVMVGLMVMAILGAIIWPLIVVCAVGVLYMLFDCARAGIRHRRE